MLFLKIHNLSSTLSPALFEVLQDSQILYTIREMPVSFCLRVIRFTVLRTLLPLELEILNMRSGQRLILSRSFFAGSYKILSSDKRLIYTFEEKHLWRNLLNLRREIRDRYGNLIGIVISKNPLTLGYQTGHIMDNQKNIVATYQWSRFSFFKDFSECKILINREEKDWILLSLVAALIKALYNQKR